MVNLRDHGELFDKFKDAAGKELAGQGISSATAIELIKQTFNLDVIIFPGAKMWEVWMDERTYVEFMLKYG